MIRKLLLPLDGSRLAEAALGWGLRFAEAFDATVVLLHVLERNAPRTIHGESHLRGATEAEGYMEGLIRGFPDGVVAESHVHTVPEGDLAASIARHAAELGTDLAIVSAHGSPGVRGRLLGGVAQHVLRQATSPVLLLRPESAHIAGREMGGLLVPLDGTPEAEAILPLVLEVADRMRLPVRLLMVVPTVGTVRGDRAATARVSPLATAAVLDVEQEAAVGYVDTVVSRLRERGFEAMGEVARGDAVDLVAGEAGREDIGIVAMASHGRSGFAALWSQSVGAGVQARVHRPVLLLNPAQPRDQSAEDGEPRP